MHTVCVAPTPPGIATLLAWLSQPQRGDAFPSGLGGTLFRLLAAKDSLTPKDYAREQPHLVLVVRAAAPAEPAAALDTLAALDALDVVAVAGVLQYVDLFEVFPWFAAGASCEETVRTLLAGVNALSKTEEHPHIIISGWETMYSDAVKIVKRGTEWDDSEHKYGMYVLGEDVVVKGIDGTSVGDVWVDDSGSKFMMDRLTREDVAVIKANSTVGYRDEYYDTVLGDPHLRSLSRCVRQINVDSDTGTETMAAVSWVLVHLNYSVGLAGTIDTHMKKGLATRALTSLVIAYREYVSSQWNQIESSKGGSLNLRPYCYVLDSNIASRRLMVDKLGFARVANETFEWMGIRY